MNMRWSRPVMGEIDRVGRKVPVESDQDIAKEGYFSSHGCDDGCERLDVLSQSSFASLDHPMRAPEYGGT